MTKRQCICIGITKFAYCVTIFGADIFCYTNYAKHIICRTVHIPWNFLEYSKYTKYYTKKENWFVANESRRNNVESRAHADLPR